MPCIATTDIQIHQLNLGGNPFGWTTDRDSTFAVLDAYRGGGGNFLDTADVYSAWVAGNHGGESETLIGQWMAARGNRDEMVIATKVGMHPQFMGLGAPNVHSACEASLARLGIDHIDLYYAHRDDETQAIPDMAVAFDGLVRQGLVRAIGVSNFTPERIVQWLDFAAANGLHRPVALQPEYSLAARQSFETDYVAMLAEHELSVFSYFSLASGFLTGKYASAQDAVGAAREGRLARYCSDEGFALVDVLTGIAKDHQVAPATVALGWLLNRGVTAPIASASSAAQVAELVAVVDLELTRGELAALDDASAPFA